MENKDSAEFISITGRSDMENLGLIELKLFEHQNVRTSTLSAQMENMVASLQKVLEKLPNLVGGFQLKEMEISLEVTAKGHVNLLGSGGEAGGTGGIKLKLIKS